MNFYTRKEAYEETLKYFNGDTLAANVWINKYALKGSNDEIYESNPNDMHKRIAKELARVEAKYPNGLSYQKIFDLLKDFKYIIPQGSPMSGIGNDMQVVSLSNCFVIGNNSDSYGGLCLTDQEQVQLMKRRGGVGHDLSHIRPKGSPVKNSALTSTGVVPFMERFSNSTREVAQDGRRGALMLSILIDHPDSADFIDAKMTEGKVTGANVSVKISDKFMNAVNNSEQFFQNYPIDSNTPKFTKTVNALELWKKIIHNAWKSAEPGILFWDTIINESVPDCYADLGFKTVSTNPCGEIPLCPYDSCRLLAINLYSYVDNPFTKDAKFNYDLFKEHIIYAQRFMDDIIDLELEKIDQILAKIESDPEENHIKMVEVELWKKIQQMATEGRRTGLGITAEGDMLAALGFKYGTKDATDFAVSIQKLVATYAYRSSCIMAKERGAFPIYDFYRELKNPFIARLFKEDPELKEMMLENGRRNIALLTIAPTGTVSLMSQTTSGLEPVFLPYYKRRRKVNPNDKDARIVYTDEVGDSWEEYFVFHPKFILWAELNGYGDVTKMNDDEVSNAYKNSPYFEATANDVDWVEKVRMQGEIQKWVDHSISVTINLPNDVSEDLVDQLYRTAWSSGCKGVTVYRDGSRGGVLISAEEKKEEVKEEEKSVDDILKENNAPKRPKKLECDVWKFKNKGEQWVAFIGLSEVDKTPYEIFTGRLEDFPIPGYVEKGWIIKVKEYDEEGKEKFRRYDFDYKDKAGYVNTMRGLSRAFDELYWDMAKMISAFLRHKIHMPTVINLIDSLKFEGEIIGTWKAGVKRTLRKYIKENIKNIEDPNVQEEDLGLEICPECGKKSYVNEAGCGHCLDCGFGECE